jgi:hypothetical protein
MSELYGDQATATYPPIGLRRKPLPDHPPRHHRTASRFRSVLLGHPRQGSLCRQRLTGAIPSLGWTAVGVFAAPALAASGSDSSLQPLC